MKILLLFLFVYFVSGISSLDGYYERSFQGFINQYKKSYSEQNYQRKFETFKSNLDYIEKHNSDPTKTFKLKMNQFGDLTNKEFSSAFLFEIKNRTRPLHLQPEDPSPVALPTSWDWRAKGAVTKVKDQGQCGSCWAFSVTGTVESCHFINTGKLVSVSEQDLVDCSTQDGNQGCNGGLMDGGYLYIIQNGGIDSESCYPYSALDGTCHYNKSCCASTITSYTDLPQGDEAALQKAVYITTISVAMDASHSSFQFYSGGVYYEPECSSTNVDHTGLAVGWGVLSGVDYWIVKNSWTVDWGMEGYILMSRNRGNNCGIASMSSYPTGCFDCK